MVKAKKCLFFFFFFLSWKQNRASYSFSLFAEFTNPYGIRSTSPGNSKSSSDELSQFGTARDYHDFDMQNDLFWYNEKDDGNFMTPSFEGPDFFGCPSEDKFIMTSDIDKQWENPLDLNKDSKELQSDITIEYLDKACHFSVIPAKDESEVRIIDYYHFDKSNQLEASVDGDRGGCVNNECTIPCCNFSMEGKGFYGENPKKVEYLSNKQTAVDNFDVNIVDDVTQPDIYYARGKGTDKSIDYADKIDSTNYWAESFDNSSDLHDKVAKKDFMSNGINKYEVGNYEMNEEANELKAAKNSEDDAADEILMCDTHEDDFEVFDLRIIHRKNRFVGILLAKVSVSNFTGEDASKMVSDSSQVIANYKH